MWHVKKKPASHCRKGREEQGERHFQPRNAHNFLLMFHSPQSALLASSLYQFAESDLSVPFSLSLSLSLSLFSALLPPPLSLSTSDTIQQAVRYAGVYIYVCVCVYYMYNLYIFMYIVDKISKYSIHIFIYLYTDSLFNHHSPGFLSRFYTIQCIMYMYHVYKCFTFIYLVISMRSIFQ